MLSKMMSLFIIGLVLVIMVITGCSPKTAPADDPNRSKHFEVESNVVSADTDFVVKWRNMPGEGDGRDWVTLVTKDTPSDKWGQWIYTDGPSGEFEVRGNSISEPGEYEVRAYYDYPSAGYEIQDRLLIIVE